MRRCKYSQCRQELPPARQCTDHLRKRGFCGIECATQGGIEKARLAKAKNDRKLNRIRKERLKTLSERKRDLQTLVNKYVRLRDSGNPCISCDKPDDGSHQRHASHYRSVGACGALRFNTLNIHASCAQCNSHQSGNILEYRIRLVRKFGEPFVERLEAVHEPRKYTEQWIEQAKRIFRRKIKILEKRVK